jgi:hypothetical protein
MCLHASWMQEAFCSRCHPVTPAPPKSRTGAGRATRDFVVDAMFMDTLYRAAEQPDVLADLLDMDDLPAYGSKQDPGCIYMRQTPDSTWERGLAVTLLSGKQTLTTASRAVYAAARANRKRPMIEGEHASHLCSEASVGLVRRICMNPIHIVVA